jgi:hypothetical protein
LIDIYGDHWRHNSILNFIYHQLKSHSQYEVFIDLPGEHEGISTIPTDVVISNLKPDLVMLNRSSHHIVLFELSVPFERNIQNTHTRKVKRYEQLISDIEDNKYRVNYYPVEIGSRGYIDKDNANRIKSIAHKYCKDVNISSFKNTICKTSLIGSYVIYHSKFDESWINPPLIDVTVN